MSRTPIDLTPDLYNYLLSILPEEHSVLVELREETSDHPNANMQVSPEQGRFLALLVQLTGARSVLEIGTFTGYSTLWMALALPPHGKIITCDIDERAPAIGRKYWKKAGVEDRIELRSGRASDSLDLLLAQGEERNFDIAFIDADKESYIGYYEYALKLVRPGGLILVDNVLWSGKVIDPEVKDVDTEAIRRFNEYVKSDTRVTVSVLPVADGLTLALRH